MVFNVIQLNATSQITRSSLKRRLIVSQINSVIDILCEISLSANYGRSYLLAIYDRVHYQLIIYCAS